MSGHHILQFFNHSINLSIYYQLNVSNLTKYLRGVHSLLVIEQFPRGVMLYIMYPFNYAYIWRNRSIIFDNRSIGD